MVIKIDSWGNGDRSSKGWKGRREELFHPVPSRCCNVLNLPSPRAFPDSKGELGLLDELDSTDEMDCMCGSGESQVLITVLPGLGREW